MSDRTRLDEPRHDAAREWETFARRDEADPLRHVGSVTAATAERAHDHAARLFPDAGTLWLCPTDEVARFTRRDLGERPPDSAADHNGDTRRSDGTTDAEPANAGVDQ